MPRQKTRLAAAAACLAMLASGSAPAAEPVCIVRLFPPGADDAWRNAAIKLEQRVRTLPQGSTDCQELDVDVVEGHATLTFVTRDGRKAVREVALPDDLVTTAEVLFVTLPPEPNPAPPAQPPAAVPPPAPPPPPPPAAPPPPPPPVTLAPASVVLPPRPPATVPAADTERRGPGFLFGASGGLRIGAPSALASPALAVAVGAALWRWEVSARAQWDPAHVSMALALPDGFRLSWWAVMLSAGRREPIGPVILSYGALVGVAHLGWSAPLVAPPGGAEGMSGNNMGTTAPPPTTMEGDKTEPRIGLYFGTSLPRRSPFRFHTELCTDAIATRMGRGLEVDPSIPPLPWWSASLSVGVEGDVP